MRIQREALQSPAGCSDVVAKRALDAALHVLRAALDLLRLPFGSELVIADRFAGCLLDVTGDLIASGIQGGYLQRLNHTVGDPLIEFRGQSPDIRPDHARERLGRKPRRLHIFDSHAREFDRSRDVRRVGARHGVLLQRLHDLDALGAETVEDLGPVLREVQSVERHAVDGLCPKHARASRALGGLDDAEETIVPPAQVRLGIRSRRVHQQRLLKVVVVDLRHQSSGAHGKLGRLPMKLARLRRLHRLNLGEGGRDGDDVLVETLVAGRAGRKEVRPGQRQPPVAGMVATGHTTLRPVVLDLERTLLELLFAVGALPGKILPERLLDVIVLVAGELDERSLPGRPAL